MAPANLAGFSFDGQPHAPERGQSPSAARRSVEARRIPGSSYRITRCGPGRSAVQRRRCQRSVLCVSLFSFLCISYSSVA